MKHRHPIYHRRDRWCLLFWPCFALRYFLVEHWNPAVSYHPVYCTADDRIPFLEVFLIPYFLWYFCIAGIHIWLYRRNDPGFRMYSRYLITTMCISTAVFLIYPTSQQLRPVVFPRDNLLTDAVKLLYGMDTSTNVCPSEHVIGSAGFFLAVCYAEQAGRMHKLLAAAAAFLTAAATVFLKQHSLVDVLAAIPVCVVGWLTAFRMPIMGDTAAIRKFFGDDPMKGASL